MSTELLHSHPPGKAEEVDKNLFHALKVEFQHELRNIQHPKEPVGATESDGVVQKHFPGLFITILVFVVLVLVATIAGIAIYTHR